jgi:hypothetical protein
MYPISALFQDLLILSSIELESMALDLQIHLVNPLEEHHRQLIKEFCALSRDGRGYEAYMCIFDSISNKEHQENKKRITHEMEVEFAALLSAPPKTADPPSAALMCVCCIIDRLRKIICQN